jgi:phage portal protein BeeE
MALFSRKVNKAAISPQPAKAAAAGANSYANMNAKVNVFNQYYSWREGEQRNQLMTIPAVSRCRDLMASVISCMPLRMYNMMWNGERMEKVYIAPRAWLRQPDPQNTYAHFMSWVFDDLYMYGRSIIHITSRTSDGYPASFNGYQSDPSPAPIRLVRSGLRQAIKSISTEWN